MSDKPKKYKGVVIGLGFIGAGDPVAGQAIGQSVTDLDGTHTQAMASNPQVQLAAGSDLDEGRRKRFEERFQGSASYANWKEMLATEKPDIASVATNSPYHAQIVAGCAEAGIRAVLCEKPIATRLSDADRAVRASRDHKTILVVNHSRRWHPLWRALRDEIRNGAIGEISHAVAHWPTGRLGNVGTHVFDALRLLTGAEAQAVSATVDPVVPPDCRGPRYHDPGGWGIVSFSNDAKAFVDASHVTKGPLLVRVVGSLGQAAIRGSSAVIEPWNGPPCTISAPNDKANSLERAVADIVKCLEHGGPPASTGEDGLAALEMIIAFHVSDRLRGQWVPLPLKGADRELEVRIG